MSYVGPVWTVPCLQLTALLHKHLGAVGSAADGRLFVGERDRVALPKLTVFRTRQQAREAVFTAEVLAGLGARRPYDLRRVDMVERGRAGNDGRRGGPVIRWKCCSRSTPSVWTGRLRRRCVGSRVHLGGQPSDSRDRVSLSLLSLLSLNQG